MKKIRMPSWPEYRELPDEAREHMYQRWCRQQQLDPAAAGVGDLFVSSIPDHALVDQSSREPLQSE